MDYEQIDLHDDELLLCPVTEQTILAPESFEPSPATLGAWVDGLAEEPEHLAEKIREPWEAYLSAKRGIDEDVYPEEFVKSLDLPNAICYEIQTGPGWAAHSTSWILIDLNHTSDIDAT